MDNILLFVISGEKRSSWERAIELSKQFDAALFALYTIDDEQVKRIANLRGRDEIDVSIEMEEEGWKYLYHIEDMAINNEVKSAIFLEEGSPINLLKKHIKDKDIDLLVFDYQKSSGGKGSKTERMIRQIIEYVPCPILIEKDGGK